jgi:hypothetical protein
VAAIVTQSSIGSCVDAVSLRQSPCEWVAEGSFVKLMLEQVLVQGFLVALLGAGLAVAVKALARRRREAVVAVGYPE